MMMKKQQPVSCVPNTNPPSSLGLNRDSQTISKVRPKVRIIHIFAPEIIKTDVHNFRELVQRLTGKPPPPEKHNGKKRTTVPCRKMELRATSCLREKIKGEDEIWRGADSGGGFLGGLPEFDGFMEELNNIPPFPMIPLDVPVYNPADNVAS